MCVWQVEGQWWMMIDQESALGGSVPSWASVAWPEKFTTSPTFQVSDESGVSTVAVGGVFPTVTVMGALMSEPPRWSLTLRRTE